MAKLKSKIEYSCPSCNKKYSVETNVLNIPSLNPGQSLFLYKTCENKDCNNNIQIDFGRPNDLNNLSPTNVTIYKGVLPINLNNLNYVPILKETSPTVFRPLNKKVAVEVALSKKLISEQYKTADFNFRGRRGTFLYDNNSLAFLSLSEQNNDSLERIAYAAENLSYQILEKRQSAAKKDLVPMKKNVQLYFIDSKNDCESFRNLLNKRKEMYAGEKNPKPLKRINDNLLVAKRSIVSRVKNMPKIAIRSVIFEYLPITGIAYTAYRGINFIKSIIDLKSNALAISKEINEVNEDINGRSLSEYEAEKSALENNLAVSEETMNAEYNDIKLGTSGYNNLSSLDNFMLAGGLQLVDSDADGFTDTFYNPQTETYIDNPFTIIRPEDVGQENYDNFSQAWQDLQEYELARFGFSNIVQDLNSLINGNGDLPHLHETLDNLMDEYNFNENDINDNLKNLGIAAGFLIGFGLSIGISVYFNNYAKKMKYGSSLRPLKNDELQSLYCNNLYVDTEKILNPETFVYSELKKNLADSKEKNAKNMAELNSKKASLEQIIKELPDIEAKVSANEKELEIYKEFASTYAKLINYVEYTNPNSNLDSISSLNIDYNDLFGKFNIDKKLFEESLPHIKLWNNLMNTGKELSNKYIKFEKEKPVLEKRVKELDETAAKDAELIFKQDNIFKKLKSSMLDHLIADPELIFTQNYSGFGDKYNFELVSLAAENKSDLDNARKKMKKMKKAILNAE
jgi:hypothetical protein